ncbi:uncharacterized protein LOC100841707 [Brachypodium distachyon]|uniref:uncharacterized protein LOC100841707 n=1 Tax=Brachypodium distachyon TaxID=15368 RepID=UPI000D0D6026|nr:uncharacterized protein LOC100841707 [Brachypodium distachyon]|eukprot:XP_024311966.1 uncharacterized protein LOC100841707 [Brachypodium distachyon]
MLALTAGQSSPPAGAVRKPRDPTPDHPPYSWMIGEAIAALGEDGGSAEAAISDFIRGRHPGVPAAHDKFLRHYLAKHVAEGLFVCVAPGRYACRPDETELALAEVPAEKPPSPATEAKRGRGRPRKDGSWPASPAGKEKVRSEPPPGTVAKRGRGRLRKDGSWPASPAGKEKVESEPPPATMVTPVAKRGRGRPRKDGSSPASAAGKEKVESELPPAAMVTPVAKRGRGRPRKDGSSPASAAGKEKVESELPPARGRSRFRALAAAAGVSGEALLLTDMEDGNEAPLSTAEPRELARSSAPSATLDDCGEAPSAKRPLVANEPAAFNTPESSTQLAKLVPVAADEGSAPALAADEEHGTEAPRSKYRRRRRSCSSAPAEATHGSAPASIADKAADKTLSATPKGRGRQHKSAPVTSAASDGTPNKARSVPVKPRCQPRKLFQLTAGEVPDPPSNEFVKIWMYLDVYRCIQILSKLRHSSLLDGGSRLFCVLALPAPTTVATK